MTNFFAIICLDSKLLNVYNNKHYIILNVAKTSYSQTTAMDLGPYYFDMTGRNIKVSSMLPHYTRKNCYTLRFHLCEGMIPCD